MARRAAQSLAANVLATADSSEIANRFLKHDFRTENPNVLCESLSTGRWPLKWLESWRGNPSFSEPAPQCIQELQVDGTESTFLSSRRYRLERSTGGIRTRWNQHAISR